MAAPASQKNDTNQSLDTLYGADGTGRLKIGIGDVTLTGLTPKGAAQAVGTHIKDEAIASGDTLVLMGVSDDGGNVVPVVLDASGNLPVVFGGALGAISLDGGSLPVVQYDGLDTTREPKVFKSFSGTVITSETTIWTPASGKKFRLMGFVITQGVAEGDITLKDDTGGTTILTIPSTPVGQPLAFSLGRIGLLSAVADNVLTATGVSTETISGFVYGTEE